MSPNSAGAGAGAEEAEAEEAEEDEATEPAADGVAAGALIASADRFLGGLAWVIGNLIDVAEIDELLEQRLVVGF